MSNVMKQRYDRIVLHRFAPKRGIVAFTQWWRHKKVGRMSVKVDLPISFHVRLR
jgi:hypothetical protein